MAKTSAQDFAHHAEIVAGRESGGANVELAILIFLEALGAGNDHGADRVGSLDVAVVIDLDAARHARQLQRRGELLEEPRLRGGVGELPAQGFARVRECMFDDRRFRPARRDADFDFSLRFRR